MKFTNGNWMMQPGVRAFYATEVFEFAAGENALNAIVSTRTVHGRGSLLDGPVLTIRLSSPIPGVIRVKVTHFAGAAERGPRFPLSTEEDTAGTVTIGSDNGKDTISSVATLKSGNISVEIREGKGGWAMTFRDADGEPITESSGRSLGLMQTEQGTFLQEQLSLGVGENVYGLGERFTAFVKNGQVVDTWNRDGGTGSDQAYKCVPFYLTNRGYGVFVNHPENVSFEVASEKVSRVQFSVPGETLEYFVIHGPTPKEVLEKYTRLTGRPALPPAWSFGLWLTTSFTTDYDEKTVNSFLDGMRDRELPLSVFHFDCFWMRGWRWCDFEWNPATFPDPVAMLKRLHERGLKVCVWINPYIAQASPLFAEGAKNGYLLKKTNGDVWQTDQWQPGMGIVDFTNPAAREWYASFLRRLADEGVDSFKTDFGERIPTDGVAWHDGSDAQKMHNYYPYLYNETVFRVLEEKRGVGEAALFARSATVGGQQFPVHWGGDCSSTFESMAESLRGGLSLGASGFGFWSHDIGGFEGSPPPAVYKRWIAFGLLSSHSRLHGSSSYRVPWLFDEEAVDVLRHFTKLKHRLMPYLYSKAVEAHETGVPVMRAMVLEYPDDPACDSLDRQYMLGDALLVAPVFQTNGNVSYYVPAGTWTHFATGETVVGPRFLSERHGYLSVPLLVRPNTLLPVGDQDDRPDYAYTENTTFRLYQLEPGQTATATVQNPTGESLTITARRDVNGELTVESSPPNIGWKTFVISEKDLSQVRGHNCEVVAEGVLINNL